jgi:hypothetical protein
MKKNCKEVQKWDGNTDKWVSDDGGHLLIEFTYEDCVFVNFVMRWKAMEMRAGRMARCPCAIVGLPEVVDRQYVGLFLQFDSQQKPIYIPVPMVPST